MKNRLELARELLADDGIIFVSIDDNEQAYLKVLMDEIFGEENFISNLVVELTKTQGMKVGAAKKGSVVKGYENVLMYAKNLDSIDMVVKQIMYDKTDTRYDTHYNQYWDSSLKTPITITEWLRNQNFAIKEFEKYQLKITTQNIDKLMNISNEFNDFIIKNSSNFFHIRNIDSDEIQNINNIELNKVFEYKKYLLIKKSESSKIQQLQSMEMSIKLTNDYVPEIRRSSIRGNLWKGFDKDLSNLDKEGNVLFKNGKKPIRLIKQLIEWVNNKKDLVVLDFFAGSGTTAQAVMELNEEDGGNRRFILCTNNENNIATDICRERIYRVINGKGSKNEIIDWKYSDNKKSLNNNSMKYLRVKPIHKINGDYEDINDMEPIYVDEFDKDYISIKDFK